MFESGIQLANDDIAANEYYLFGNLASALHWSGEHESARTSYERAIELAESVLEEDGTDQSTMTDLAGYYGMVGQHDRGVELLELVTRQEILDPNLMGMIAESFEDLGERDRAVEWIGIALENGIGVDWIESRPSFNSLQDDDRYRELIRQFTSRG